MSTTVHYMLQIDDRNVVFKAPEIKDEKEHKKMLDLYRICVENGVSVPDRFKKYVRSICKGELVVKPEVWMALLECGVLDWLSWRDFRDECGFSWDEEDVVMREVSQRQPELLFSLFVHWPEHDAQEVHYYMGGKKQVGYGRWVFDEFDDRKLK